MSISMIAPRRIVGTAATADIAGGGGAASYTWPPTTEDGICVGWSEKGISVATYQDDMGTGSGLITSLKYFPGHMDPYTGSVEYATTAIDFDPAIAALTAVGEWEYSPVTVVACSHMRLEITVSGNQDAKVDVLQG